LSYPGVIRNYILGKVFFYNNHFLSLYP